MNLPVRDTARRGPAPGSPAGVRMVVGMALLLGLGLLAVAPAGVQAAGKTVEVHLMMSADGARAYFDPAGIHIQAGDTVRWVQVANYHSVTAYDPSNDNHERRIPDRAKPWDSDILLGEYPAAGSTFEHRFTVEGVYDYYCKPHEAAGMVGRIVVGKPGDGPGPKHFGYAPGKHWKPVPEIAQKAFPSVEEIMRRGVVPAPQ